MTALFACGADNGSDAKPSGTDSATESGSSGTGSTTESGPSETGSTTSGDNDDNDDNECITGCEDTTGDVEGPGIPMALAIQYADGVGGFGEPQLVDLDLGVDAIESYPVEVLVADLNDDEYIDLLVYHSRELLALAGTQDGEFTALDSIFVDNLRQVVPANNADGTAGVLVYDWYSDDMNLLFHPWNGRSFGAQQAHVAPPQGALGSGDLDGDGIADAIVAGRDELLDDGIDVYTFMNIGGGAVVSEASPNLVDSIAPTGIETADLDGDGLLDVVMTVDDHDYDRIESPVTGAVVLLRGDGAGAFLTQSTTEFQYAPREALVGDFNGSDGLDVLVRDGSDDLHVAFNDGAGALSPEPLAAESYGLLAVGHVNDDLRNDALVGTSQIFALIGQPRGSFDWVELDGGHLDDRATLADVDGDGFDDVIRAVRPNE